MATIYVDTDNFLDLVTYAAGDTVTVRYGAQLRIRKTNATKPFKITSSDAIIELTSAYRELVFAAGGYVNCVAGDIGKPVVGATTGDSGTLVSYDNGTMTWWVLRDDPTDDFFDNASESISITGGTGAGTLNALPAQYIDFHFTNTVNSGFEPTGTSQFISNGDWYVLGTGNGSSGQTFSFFGGEACPFAQVETGAATNVWTDCRCVYDKALTYYGAGTILGNVFKHAPDAGVPITDLTFGDGTNGIVVPNGARVRVPDIFVTSDAAYTGTIGNRSRVYTSSGSIHNVSNVNFSDRFYLTVSQASSMTYSYVGTFGRSTIAECYSIDFDHFIVSRDRDYININACDFSMVKGTIDDTQAECTGSSTSGGCYGLSIRQSQDVVATNCYGYSVGRVVGGSATASCGATYVYNSFNIKLENCVTVGGRLVCASTTGITVINHQTSDTTNGTKITTLGTDSCSFSLCSDIRVDGWSVLSGGSPPYLTYFAFSSGCYGGIATGIDFNPDSHSQYALQVYQNCADIIVANCNWTGSPRTGYYYIDNGNKRVSLRNILTSSASYSIAGPRELRVEGCVSASPLESHTSEYDSPYQFIYTSNAKTAGYICLVMTPETDLEYYEHLSGDADASIYFNNSGRLYMKTIGDQCTFEIPYLIQGVDSFQNVSPTILHADFAGSNFTREYAIKDGAYGSAWSAWKTLSAANLSAETVDSEVGFYLKFRFTCLISGATNNYCSRLMIPVNTDSDFSFPVGYVPITLTGMVSGSKYWIYDDTNERTLEIGTSDGSDVTVYAPCNYDGSSLPISARVRKGDAAPFYEPWEISATYSDDGTVIQVGQVAAAIQDDIGETFFSFDSPSKIIEIADTETEVTIQELVNAIREYETDYIAEDQIASTSGKDELRTGLYMSIKLELLNDWRVKFEDRAGPTWTSCEVVAGNLITTNSFGNNPIAPGAYVTATRAMSTEAALLAGDDPIRLEP